MEGGLALGSGFRRGQPGAGRNVGGQVCTSWSPLRYLGFSRRSCWGIRVPTGSSTLPQAPNPHDPPGHYRVSTFLLFQRKEGTHLPHGISGLRKCRLWDISLMGHSQFQLTSGTLPFPPRDRAFPGGGMRRLATGKFYRLNRR